MKSVFHRSGLRDTFWEMYNVRYSSFRRREGVWEHVSQNLEHDVARPTYYRMILPMLREMFPNEKIDKI